MHLLLLFYLAKGFLGESVFLLGVDALPLLLDDLGHLVCGGCRELAEDVWSKFVGEVLEDDIEHWVAVPIGRQRVSLGSIGRLLSDGGRRGGCLLLYLRLLHPSLLLFGLDISLKPPPFPLLQLVLLDLQ